jgi:hypothetical protein
MENTCSGRSARWNSTKRILFRLVVLFNNNTKQNPEMLDDQARGALNHAEGRSDGKHQVAGA